MAIFSFIEEYDLSGKTIVPFCAHGIGGIAAGVKDITAALPDSVTVLDALGVYRADIGNSEPAVQEWLTELGFAKKRGNIPRWQNEERKLENDSRWTGDQHHAFMIPRQQTHYMKCFHSNEL